MLLNKNINVFWASIIVEELIRHGINYFCISPGSRSTPIVVAIGRNEKSKSIICYDERGAAYHALGYAKATGKPAVVITTSGTAVANCFPAIIESSMDNVPLVVISADRPPELQDTKANQTIYQSDIFGKYVRFFFNLPCPNENIPVQMVLTTIDQAIFRCLSYPQGPVHLNCMFREPLSPEQEEFSLTYKESAYKWFISERVYTKYSIPTTFIDGIELKNIVDIINNAKRGFIIIGGLKKKEKKAVLEFVKNINWPVLLDIRSQINPTLLQNSLPNFVLLLRFVSNYISPDVILHIGSIPISKYIFDFIQQVKPKEYVVIKDHPFRQDPNHISTMQISVNIEKFCESIIPFIHPQKSNILDKLKQISCKVSSILKSSFQDLDSINEASLAYFISRYIPENSGLFLSNSLIIRNMDMYAQFNKSNVNIAANRGASGIDGIIATATGFAEGLNNLVTLIIGDIAFLHDLNSLFILNSIHAPLIIILINNNGGGIFSFLPISKFEDIFKKYFVVPHNISSFQGISSFMGLPYFCPKNISELLNTYKECVNTNKSSIIEIKTNIDNVFEFQTYVLNTIKQYFKNSFKNCIDKG